MANNNQERMDKVVKALDQVNPETKQMIFNMAKSMKELEVIQSFNQQSLDFFNLSTAITRRMGRESEFKMAGYKALYDNTIKMNIKMPIDNFTLVVLEYAPQIYSENEDFFLNQITGDTKVEVGNEFSLIKSEMFKNLWKILNKPDRADIKEKVILLTTFAHVYFYQTILKNKKKLIV